MLAAHHSQPRLVGLLPDEPIRLEGLAGIFDFDAGSSPLAPHVGTLEELLGNPDVRFLVIDLNSAASSEATLRTVRKSRPDIRLIVIGQESNEELILSSIQAGARAFLDSKAGPETVQTAMIEVARGSIWAPRRLLSRLIDQLLNGNPKAGQVAEQDESSKDRRTSRERQVLDLILQAKTNREIANQLGIEERTVKAHVGRLMRKAGVENRVELCMQTLKDM